MNATALKRAKREIRRRVLAARDELSDADLAGASAAVAQRVLELPELRTARIVMAFSSFGSELSTEPLIEALVGRGIVVGLPKVAHGELEVFSFRPGDATTIAAFGAAEPSGGDAIDPLDIDVVITPAIAFDRVGGRVGYGGGYYDRFLPRTRQDAIRIGVATSVQVVDEELPTASFDLRVDVIVTPDETIRCAR